MKSSVQGYLRTQKYMRKQAMLKAMTGPWNQGVSSSSVITNDLPGLTLKAAEDVNLTGFLFNSSAESCKGEDNLTLIEDEVKINLFLLADKKLIDLEDKILGKIDKAIL